MGRASMKFGTGKDRAVYYMARHGVSRAAALKTARNLRRRGYKARIYEETNGWTVFTRPAPGNL